MDDGTRFILDHDVLRTTTGVPAFIIDASDVVFDCNGHSIAGPGGSAPAYDNTDLVGVLVKSGDNVIVRNCDISGSL